MRSFRCSGRYFSTHGMLGSASLEFFSISIIFLFQTFYNILQWRQYRVSKILKNILTSKTNYKCDLQIKIETMLPLINALKVLKIYKNTNMQNPGEEFRTKREQFATEIRRQNRQQILAKRRNISAQSEEPTQKNTNSSEHIIDPRFADKIKQFQEEFPSKDKFMNYLTCIHDPDILKQHQGIIGIRKLLTSKASPPIQQVIDVGLIPKLINYAKQSEYPQLQLEAAWCLTNVAAGNTTQTSSIIEKGGIKMFVDLLLSTHVGIVEQAVWALGNIACDSSSYRDSIIKNGGLKNLIRVVEVAVSQLPKNPKVIEVIQSAIWSLSGICRTQPLPNYLLIKDALPAFFYVVKNKLIKDISILGNVCWAISYNTNKTKEGPTKIDKIQACIDSGVVPVMIEYLENTYDNLVVACLKTIGNVANGNDTQSAYLISLGVMDKLELLLSKTKKVYRRQACWVLSNLTAGPTQQIQAVFSKQSLVAKLLELLKQDLTDIRIEICYIFANATEQGDPQKMLAFLLDIDYTKYLSQIIMSNPESNLLFAALQCLESILHFGKSITKDKKSNVFAKQVHKLKLIEKLQELQYHEDDKIYQAVFKILPTYFELEDALNI